MTSKIRATLLLGLLWALPVYGESFEQFEPLVHIVKIKATRDSSEFSRGTGFVVARDGRILTNYHVVSELFKDGKIDTTKQAFVRIGDKEYAAEISKIDILNDLTLLKIPHEFGGQVRIRNTPLMKGERIYSLGFHEKEFMAINQGTFNDYLKDTENELMAVSAPLNHGMSGGPIVDQNFAVVGVNVLKSRKEADGYGINAQRLLRFLGSASEAAKDSLDRLLAEQVEQTYGKIISSIQSASTFHNLNNWKLPNFEHFMACGEYSSEVNLNEDKDDKDQDQILILTKVCHLDARKVPISTLGAEVSIQYAIANIRASKNTTPQSFYNYLNSTFKFQNWRSVFSDDDKYLCRKGVFKNRHGLDFQTSICMFKHESRASFIKEGDYYRYEVKAVTLAKELDDALVQISFSGSKKVAQSIIRSLLDGVSKQQGDSRAGRQGCTKR